MTAPRRIAVGSDMRHPVADAIAMRLEKAGHSVADCGAVRAQDTPWPDVAEQVARLVASGAADTGVVCCWTGTGVSIAANKVPGIRAALCGDAATATGARRWNDANVLALSLRATSEAVAAEIVDAWLAQAGPDPAEAASIARVGEIERRYRDRAPAEVH
ncbi:MAG: RpiB/LacA/LacB family sugar-phosphate isomerase [Chloroflexi bacterium]|nr:MAG: RpiB/LacA/LacB family sugar-phosphate isomerase [Chloroflexota bacterium]